MYVLRTDRKPLQHLVGAQQLLLHHSSLTLEDCLKYGINWFPEATSRWAAGVMMAGFIKASEVGPNDDPTATKGPFSLPWESLPNEIERWAAGLPLFNTGAKLIRIDNMLMHMTSEDTITFLYDPSVPAAKIQQGVLASCDEPTIVQVCKKRFEPWRTGIAPAVEAYLRGPQSEVGSPSYVPPSQALAQADRLEMLERAGILFIPEPWFQQHLEHRGFLTAQTQRPRWYHFWADAFRLDDPTKVSTVEGILEQKAGGWRVYPKCDPGLVSFWKEHIHIWNKVEDLKSISLLVDAKFPAPAFPERDDLAIERTRLQNVRVLPLDYISGSTAVGVRVSPTFGTGGIFVIPNMDGGLIRGELGDFPRPEASSLREVLGMPKVKDVATFMPKAAAAMCKLAIDNEQELLRIMSPPRIRMWPARRAKLRGQVGTQLHREDILSEQRKFNSVPQAWQLLQSAGFENLVPQLTVWDHSSKWLANALCMIIAMRHLRAATLFEETHTTDLYDPEKLALALLTAPATDFHAIWLCRVLGGGTEVQVTDKQEIKGATLTETADAIFG